MSEVKNISENSINKLFQLGALIFVALAIVGGVRAYSPVPFWDMWDGYLGFYTKVTSGDWSAWWAQHNEHRIVLARIFFWLDFVLFDGQGWFLMVVNYILQSAVCFLFWIIWKEAGVEDEKWIGFFLVSWLFWWIQSNNLEWGFQSQFILVQLLPLSALYFLHRAAHAKPEFNKWFFVALTSGVLSIGGMASGVLALPIMTIYALFVRLGVRRIVVLAVVSILSVGIYFYGYVAPPAHGSLTQAIRANPIGLLHYFSVYMGGPFAFGNSRAAIWRATAAGIFLIISAIYFSYKLLKNENHETLRFALLAFILFIGGTALGTAGGRLIFGVDQALASRYMTPALMAWAAIFIIYLSDAAKVETYAKKYRWVFFAVLLLLMLPKQLGALESKREQNFNRELAALAVEIGAKDEKQIQNVFPSVSWILEIAKDPIERKLSIFGVAPIKDKRDIFRSKITFSNSVKTCQGSLDELSNIDGDKDYLKIRGWIYDSLHEKIPDYALVVDQSGSVFGVFLTGDDRMDVANAIAPKARYSGAKGYLLPDAKDKALKIYAPESGCVVPVAIKHALS